MGVEVKPLGIKCNLQCQYCYQNPMRDAGAGGRRYDLAKIKAAIEVEGGPFSLFGGEPLLMPLQDLEDLWSWGFKRYGRNSIQTNGTLITDAHIVLFKRYKVGVGLSLDGPGALNDARWCGTLERTRQSTARAEEAIESLRREGLVPSIIITLHRANAARDRLPYLIDWVRYLDGIGVRRARLHLLEKESQAIHTTYGLSEEENVEALLAFARLEPTLTRLRFDLFSDMKQLLAGRDQNVTCIWNACDPYTTRAVRGIEGNGETSNCGRINKDGVEYVKAATAGFERYIALYHTPQEAGGCRGCRFFLVCKGQCPGTAIDGDWRNRSEYCEVWKAIFGVMEQEVLSSHCTPVTVSRERESLERELVEAWSNGRNPTIAQLRSGGLSRQ